MRAGPPDLALQVGGQCLAEVHQFPQPRCAERLAAAGRIRRISYAAFHYLITHGGGGPFASGAEARLIGAGPPRGAAAIRAHAEQVADVIIRGIATLRARCLTQ
jgi:hypothetical protein